MNTSEISLIAKESADSIATGPVMSIRVRSVLIKLISGWRKPYYEELTDIYLADLEYEMETRKKFSALTKKALRREDIIGCMRIVNMFIQLIHFQRDPEEEYLEAIPPVVTRKIKRLDTKLDVVIKLKTGKDVERDIKYELATIQKLFGAPYREEACWEIRSREIASSRGATFFMEGFPENKSYRPKSKRSDDSSEEKNFREMLQTQSGYSSGIRAKFNARKSRYISA